MSASPAEEGYVVAASRDSLGARTTLTVGDRDYEIFRIENAGIDTSFSLPSGAQGYVASADNLGGLIVAVSY